MPESTEEVDLKFLNSMRCQPPPLPSNRRQGKCGNCRYQHQPQHKCPATGAECHKCGWWNHFANMCHSQTQKTWTRVQDWWWWNAHCCHHRDNPKLPLTPTISLSRLAQAPNAMSCRPKMYRHISQQPLMKSKAKLIAFSGHQLTYIGKVTLLCEYKNKFFPVEFEVVDDVADVLGLKTSTEMKLVRLKAFTMIPWVSTPIFSLA